MPRTTAPLLAALSAAALLAGCGGDNSPPRASAAPPSAQKASDVVEIAMEDVEFLPERVTVRVGQTVRWTNLDAFAHTVAASQGAEFSSDGLERGDSYEFTPTKRGTVAYFCTIHPGQTGTLVVR